MAVMSARNGFYFMSVSLAVVRSCWTYFMAYIKPVFVNSLYHLMIAKFYKEVGEKWVTSISFRFSDFCLFFSCYVFTIYCSHSRPYFTVQTLKNAMHLRLKSQLDLIFSIFWGWGRLSIFGNWPPPEVSFSCWYFKKFQNKDFFSTPDCTSANIAWIIGNWLLEYIYN